jgi:hypothetical protein
MKIWNCQLIAPSRLNVAPRNFRIRIVVQAPAVDARLMAIPIVADSRERDGFLVPEVRHTLRTAIQMREAPKGG